MIIKKEHIGICGSPLCFKCYEDCLEEAVLEFQKIREIRL